MEPASNSGPDQTGNAFIETPRPSSRLSSYTLRSMRNHFYSSKSADDETSSLTKGKMPADDVESVRRYGAVSTSSNNAGLNSKETRRKLLWAGIKMAILFVVCTIALWGTLKLALPTLEEADRPDLQVPRSFEQLQKLNALLQKYRSMYPFRMVLCFVITYLFLQAFSLPGSMYMSILAGAVWGPARAIPLCCTCVASGATLCYFIGAALGPALLALPTWKARLDAWSTKIDSQRANLIPFLIVLRIAPFPPHWVVNVLCPHLGITLLPFFVSTWLGIMGVTVIHTTIGSGLDDMTSAKDFHLISWRNFFGLASVVVAVLIPVGIRWYFRSELEVVKEVQHNEEIVAAEGDDAAAGQLEAGEVSSLNKSEWKGKTVERWLLEDEEENGTERSYDDEPLPPPPTQGVASSSWTQDKKEGLDDVKLLG
ncbi:hypothetical protein FRB95_003688 [Tulasnella sp. JGI-2019a]|nr:hypothetical protein FRB95_003688 [Tulasnella sp. JGI-2019a]